MEHRMENRQVLLAVVESFADVFLVELLPEESLVAGVSLFFALLSPLLYDSLR
jgi:hypothetical protein